MPVSPPTPAAAQAFPDIGLPAAVVSALTQSERDLVADVHYKLSALASESVLKTRQAKAAQILGALAGASNPLIQIGIRQQLLTLHLDVLRPGLAKALQPGYEATDPQSKKAAAMQRIYAQYPQAATNPAVWEVIRQGVFARKEKKQSIDQAEQRAMRKQLTNDEWQALLRYAQKEGPMVDALRDSSGELVAGHKRTSVKTSAGAPDPALASHQGVAAAKLAISALNKLPKHPSGATFRSSKRFAGVDKLWQKGATVLDPGFRSTSADHKTNAASEFAQKPAIEERIREIVIGESGRNITPYSPFGAKEAEVLYPPGVRWKVVDRVDIDPPAGGTAVRAPAPGFMGKEEREKEAKAINKERLKIEKHYRHGLEKAAGGPMKEHLKKAAEYPNPPATVVMYEESVS
jgi:hypothetical protein